MSLYLLTTIFILYTTCTNSKPLTKCQETCTQILSWCNEDCITTTQHNPTLANPCFEKCQLSNIKCQHKHCSNSEFKFEKKQNQRNRNLGTKNDKCSCLCEGNVNSLILKNNGDDTVCVVSDENNNELFNDNVSENEEFVIDGSLIDFDGKGNLGTASDEIKINCGDGRVEVLNTKCSEDIYIGMVLGDAQVEIMDGHSLNGKKLCDFPASECIKNSQSSDSESQETSSTSSSSSSESKDSSSKDTSCPCACDGKVVNLIFKNTLSESQTCKITTQDNSITEYGPLQPNEEFSIAGNTNIDTKGTLGTEIHISCTIESSDETTEQTLHTSCSQDIYIGMMLDAVQLEIVDGNSLDNGQLCDVPENECDVVSSTKLFEPSISPSMRPTISPSIEVADKDCEDRCYERYELCKEDCEDDYVWDTYGSVDKCKENCENKRLVRCIAEKCVNDS